MTKIYLFSNLGLIFLWPLVKNPCAILLRLKVVSFNNGFKKKKKISSHVPSLFSLSHKIIFMNPLRYIINKNIITLKKGKILILFLDSVSCIDFHQITS